MSSAYASTELVDGEVPRRVVFASMAGVMAAMLMAALDGTIVGTAMPQAIAEMNGFEHYTAVVTMYLLASTTIVPIAGKLSDLYGRKPFLLAGVAIFVAGSALCGLSRSMLQLVFFRGIQGIGAGFTQAMAFTTIADLFPPARRGRVSGVMGSVFGLATVIGPTVGGLLTDGPGWRWCFYVNLPVGVLAFAILLAVFPHTMARKRKASIDWVGAGTLLLGVVPLLLACSWGGRDYAWGSTVVIGLLAGGLSMTGLFLFVETRAPEPILPLNMFRSRVVWTSAAGAMLVSIAMFGTVLFVPLFIQTVIGRSATQSAAVLTPLMFTLIVSSVLSGQLISRWGRYKGIAVFGMVALVVGLLLLSRMDVNTTYPAVLRDVILIGIGLGATMPVFPIAVQNAVSIDRVGVATSSIQFLRSMGGSLGAAVFGAMLTNRFASAFHRGISADVASHIAPGLLAKFENPQALMNPRLAAELKAAGPEAVQRLAPLLAAVKQALASSLQEVFLVAAAVMVVGFGVSLFLVDLPLRKTNRPTQAPAEGDVPMMSTTMSTTATLEM